MFTVAFSLPSATISCFDTLIVSSAEATSGTKVNLTLPDSTLWEPSVTRAVTVYSPAFTVVSGTETCPVESVTIFVGTDNPSDEVMS